MNVRKISGFGMSLVGILFCVSESKAESGLTFETGQITSAGIEMPYRVAHVGDADRPALVIYLHGGSSKGNDNETQMAEAGIDSIAHYLVAQQVAAIYLVPQCPADKSWGGPMLGVLKSLIDQYVGAGIVDENRLYLLGGSMGGTGTWSMLSTHPGLFAAAMPVAGNPSRCYADSVARTPVYTVMGTADRIMNVETTAAFIDELNALGGTTKFDIEEGWNHEMTCICSYTTPRLDWLFGHVRHPADIAAPTVGDKAIASVRYYSTDGRRLSAPPREGLYIIQRIYTDGTVTASKTINPNSRRQ